MKMNKSIMRIACLGILSTFLFACGKEEAPTDASVPPTESETEVTPSQAKSDYWKLPEGYALSVKFVNAEGKKGQRNYELIGNSLYYSTHFYDGKQNRSTSNVYVHEMGNEAQLLDLPLRKEHAISLMTIDEEENLYLLYEDEGNNEESRTYTLEKRDKQLQVIYTTKVTEISGSDYDMKVSSDGTLYILTLRGMVLYWDASGVYQGCFTLPVNATTAKGRICFGLVNAGESGIYAYWTGPDEESFNSVHLYDLNKWKDMDEEERKAAAPLRVDTASAPEVLTPCSNNGLYVFSGHENGLYLMDYNRLWQIDLSDGSLVPLFAWQDVSLKAEDVKEIRRQEDDSFLVYIFNTLEEENYWVSLNPIPADEIPEKIELVLGIAGSKWTNPSLMSKVDQVVLSYNRTHPECCVTIKQYEASDITNFQLELLSGKGPDILLERESFFDMDTLIGKGAVEDLAPYLAGSKETSSEDIIPGILGLITRNGKISRIPLSFSVDVMILPKDIAQKVLTPQELAEYMAGDEGTYIDYLVWPNSLLLQILFGAEIDHYIDEENKSCSFDSPEFVNLLERLNPLKDMEMIGAREERAALFHSGQLKAIVEEMNCMEDYLCIREAFSDTVVIAGFPNSEGELRYPATLYDWMGINSASKHKDAAWDFIDFCLSYTSRSDNVADRFTVLKSKFDLQTQYEDDSLYLVTWNDYDVSGNGLYDFDPTTQAETELLQGISDHLFYYDNQNLWQIIQEETSAFFAGDISAQEAAKRIQNRANLVLGE